VTINGEEPKQADVTDKLNSLLLVMQVRWGEGQKTAMIIA
jgi:hypothetical protein